MARTAKTAKSTEILSAACQLIPLEKIHENPAQLRKAGVCPEADRALRVSIQNLGLAQGIVVASSEASSGKTPEYMVVAGSRRLRALKDLQEEKNLPESLSKAGIPCRVLETAADSRESLEIAIAENDVRIPTNPVDRQEAYASLDMTPEEIAQRFGIRERQVKADLAIAGIIKPVREAARRGDLGISALRIYALAEDPKLQRDVFQRLGPHAETSVLRVELLDRGIPAGSPDVKFLGKVGLRKYEERGGRINEDLWARDGEGNITEKAELLDPHIIRELTEEMLERKAQQVQKEGWNNVRVFKTEKDALIAQSLSGGALIPDPGLESDSGAEEYEGEDPEALEGLEEREIPSLDEIPEEDRAGMSAFVFVANGKTRVMRGIARDSSEIEAEIQQDSDLRKQELDSGVEPGFSEPPDVRERLGRHYATTRARILEEHLRAASGDPETERTLSQWLLAELQTSLVFQHEVLFLEGYRSGGSSRANGHEDPEGENAMGAETALEFFQKRLETQEIQQGDTTLSANILDAACVRLSESKVRNAISRDEVFLLATSHFGLGENWRPDAQYFCGRKRSELGYLALEVAGPDSAKWVQEQEKRDIAAERIAVFANPEIEGNSKIIEEMLAEGAPEEMKAFSEWKPEGIFPEAG